MEISNNKGKELIYTHTPKLNSSEIEERFEEDAKETGLMLKKHFAFSKFLPEVGFEIKEYASVFELCKPSIAAKILNVRPELSIFMPCRISVFDKDGVTYVSTPDMSLHIDSMDLDDELKQEMSDVYNQMLGMIQKW